MDVARHAGVSPATVSRVLNNTAPVNHNTRDRVLASMSTLGYRHGMGRTATETSRGTIALLITDILNPFFAQIVRGVEDESGNNGLALLLCNTAEDQQRERQSLRMLVDHQVDGIIVCASRLGAQDLIDLHERTRIPVVVINRRIDHPRIPCVLVDFENGAYRAVQHLISLNHQRIAYLAGPGSSDSSRMRRSGMVRAMTEAGLPVNDAWCPSSFPGVVGGFQAMSALLGSAHAERPTAVFAYNDLLALGALHAIRTHNLRVPEDISVVGCDGIEMAAHSNPPLTTIDQPKYRTGKLAMQMLRQMMTGSSMPGGYTLLESPLVVRESTGRYIPHATV